MMKNVFLSKLNLIICFLLFSLSLSAYPPIMYPVHTNWLSPMVGGVPENLFSQRTYIYLNQNGEVVLDVGVTTTDDDLDAYDELHVSYFYEGFEDSFQVQEADLVEVEHGIYEAKHTVILDFNADCISDPDGTLPFEITIMLATPRAGTNDLSEYPLANNAGLFDPALYENLVPGRTASNKMLLCWGTNPPSSFTSPESSITAAIAKESTTSNDLPNTLNQELSIEKNIEDFAIYPNPFSNVFRIEYSLDVPSTIYVQLFDLTGKKVLQRMYPRQESGDHTIEVQLEESLPAGIYLVSLHTADGVKTVKVSKAPPK